MSQSATSTHLQSRDWDSTTSLSGVFHISFCWNSSASLRSLLGGLSCSCPRAGSDRDRTRWPLGTSCSARQRVQEPLGQGCPHLPKLSLQGRQPDSWIAMAETVSGLFKRATCWIYVREWTWSSWSWRALMNEMGSKILYTLYQGLTTPALSAFPCSCFPSLPLLHAQAPAVSVFSEQWHHLVCFLCQVYYRLSVRG